MAEQLTVHEALRKVSERIEFISKERTANAGGTYQYRGIEDVLRACHDPFIEFGITIMPNTVDSRIVAHDVPKFNQKGEPTGTRREYEAQMVVEYTFYGPAGDSVTASILTTGVDSGDKCTGKAASYGLKNILFQVLCIPTAAAEDNEAAGAPQEAPQAPQIHPAWPKLGERFKALPEATKSLLREKWTQEGSFKAIRGGFGPNHPLTDSHIGVMRQDIEKAERPQGLVEPSDITFKPEPQTMVDSVVSKLEEAAQPKYSITACSVMEEALGVDEGQQIPDKLWELAELMPGEIDWRKWARKLSIPVADMYKRAVAVAEGVDLPKPASLDEIDGPLSDQLRLSVVAFVVGNPNHSEAPF